jgi:hypothetical protein
MLSHRTYRVKPALFTSSTREVVFEGDRRTAMMFSTGAGGAMPEIGLLPLRLTGERSARCPGFHERRRKNDAPGQEK